DSVEAIAFWHKTKNHRWAHTSLHRVLPLPFTASTSVAVESFTTVRSRILGAGSRWKRFLSGASLGTTRCGFELMQHRGLLPRRCLVARSLGWARTSTAGPKPSTAVAASTALGLTSKSLGMIDKAEWSRRS